MAVGQNALIGALSYLAVGRETTYGTYATSTAGLNFISAGLKLSKEVKILEEIQTSRTASHAIQLGRTVEGEIEYYFCARNVASNYILQNAFGGGAITSATATGETIGGTAFTHTININNFNQTYSSLCVNLRKGDSTLGKVFEYTGLRVSEFTLKAEVDEALIATASLIGKDASATSNNVESALGTYVQSPLSFVNGRFSIETANSFTTTSYWNVQSFEFKINNNLNADQRRIGSDTIDALPAGMANFELKATLRFDTLTAYNAMIAGTRLYGQFEFLGEQMTGSAKQEGLKLTFPRLLVTEAGDPEIGGANEVLTSEVSFAVLRDPTTSGYAVRAEVTNNTSTYA